MLISGFCFFSTFEGHFDVLTIQDLYILHDLKLTMACSILLSIEPCPAPDALQKKVLVSRIRLATVCLCTSKDKRVLLVDWVYLCLEHLWCTYVLNQR